MTTEMITNVKNKIRAVNDFPKQGIIFRDITTALKEPETLKVMIDYLCDQFKDVKIDYIAGIESRVSRVEDGLFNNITGNPFLASFDSLDGITLVKGIWNEERKRIEC